MTTKLRPAPEPEYGERIQVETLCTARVHHNTGERGECVVQFSTPLRHVFLSVSIDELARLGERLLLDARIVGGGQFTGRA